MDGQYSEMMKFFARESLSGTKVRGAISKWSLKPYKQLNAGNEDL